LTQSTAPAMRQFRFPRMKAGWTSASGNSADGCDANESGVDGCISGVPVA
jgi:hypothetical protein